MMQAAARMRSAWSSAAIGTCGSYGRIQRDRHRALDAAFIIDLNGAAAAQRANVSGKNPKSAGQIASKMRKRPHVAAAISAALAEKHGIAATAILSELGAVAHARMTAL
jgi:Terminase small subunit